MPRKVRHPYQIMEADEMVVGNQYVLVRADEIYGPHHELYLFGGIITDNSHVQANPPMTDPRTITIHLDGINYLNRQFTNVAEPTLVYWSSPNSNHTGWDYLETFFGEEERSDRHCIIVPEKHWVDDPKLHLLDWKNPDDVIERKIGQVSGDWEQRVDTKRDAAMADFFGF